METLLALAIANKSDISDTMSNAVMLEHKMGLQNFAFKSIE